MILDFILEIRVFKKLSIPHYLLLLFAASVWIVYSIHGDVSNDGGLYIKQAYFFSIGDPASAMELYSWPFFAYLVARVHLILGVSLFYSAQLLNVFLFLVACLYFFRILCEIAGDQRVLFSGFVVIMTSIPLMDDYLSMILRENGSWAGFLAGSYYFIMWHKRRLFADSIKWQLSFFVAMLFRPEAYAAALLLPFFSLYYQRSNSKNLQYLLLNFSVLILLMLAGGIFLFYKSGWDALLDLDLMRFSELFYYPKSLLYNLGTPLPVEVVNHEELKSIVEHHQLALKYGLLSYAAIYSWLSGLKILHAATAWTAIKKKLVATQYKESLTSLFLPAFLATTVFVFTHLETSRRYWILSWWIVYLLSALGLNYWIEFLKTVKWSRLQRWLSRLALVVVILGYVLTVLFDSVPKHEARYMAASWFRELGVDGTQIYTDDNRSLAMLLGKYEPTSISLDEALVKRYPYLVITARGNKALDYEANGYHLVESFPSKEDPKIMIYRLD